MNENANITTARIDTLISYTDTDFTPTAHLGKLDLTASPWAISAKLGRFLLSGIDADATHEVAREIAAYCLDIKPAKLVDCVPADRSIAASIIKETPDSICFAITDSDTIVIASQKIKTRYCGEHTWHWTGISSTSSTTVFGFKLTTALGAMEILKDSDNHDLVNIIVEESNRKYAWRGMSGMEKRAAFDAAASKRWDAEGNREANRRYADPKHTATVFEDKKNCDDAHRAAAANGFIADLFKHVEIDDDIDLDIYDAMQNEFESRWNAGELPAIDTAIHSLRFRKTGRHRAIGVYCDALKGIAVDPRSPKSLLHEFAHAYDFGNGQLSCSDGFRPILDAFRSNFDSSDMTASKVAYYETPTEVFARSWEVYAAINGIGGSFVKTREEMEQDAAYAPLFDIDAIISYFDTLTDKKNETKNTA